MARPVNEVLNGPIKDTEEAESDYGSDFSPEEEDIIAGLISLGSTVTEGKADNPMVNHADYNGDTQSVQAPHVLTRKGKSPASNTAEQNLKLDSVKMDDASSTKHISSGDSKLDVDSAELNPPKDDKSDTRSPLERFRTAPKKALSVTDLVSPSWCELQYLFTLTTYGRKIPTAAMKQGSAVHQTLEDQIFTRVTVYPKTKEDLFGLRIWNVIQGLQTLRERNITRELEVWGSIDGQVINGVIDEISFTVPDEALEEIDTAKKGALSSRQIKTLDPSRSSGTKLMGSTKKPTKSKKAYICDVKTRMISGLPRGAAFRPTKIQLMIYHRLLSEMVAGKVDLSAILKRYALNGETPLTDSFIAQIGSLGEGEVSSGDTNSGSSQESTSAQVPGSSPSVSDHETLDLLLAHNSISQLWALMLSEFRRLFPAGEASIGNVLRAEYRQRADGRPIGSNVFLMNDAVLDEYLTHSFKWWRGQRDPEGVVVEEAYKCRSCEFADTCQWRIQRAAAGRMQQAWGAPRPVFD